MKFIADGYLSERAKRNLDRLMSDRNYRMPGIFKERDYEWPGDWEGRTLLAYLSLRQAVGVDIPEIGKIIDALPGYLNASGYFGAMVEDGTVNEQTLSGNGWFLRSLCEYYNQEKNPEILTYIHSIIDNVILPAKGMFNHYPLKEHDRIEGGDAIGNLLTKKVNRWILSTDVGCAFILLDGAAAAYSITRNPQLLEVIEEMIKVYLSIDFSGLKFQTHATLSALRGVLGMYHITGKDEYLAGVIDIYTLYRKEGMTASFENKNWFGKPDWTEPCAVVDSFIIAHSLWEITAEPEYLQDAHKILYTGLGHAQRSNGGFGCDICSGDDRTELAPVNQDLYEAYWCCTMRGGDGLSHAIRHVAMVKDGSAVFSCIETGSYISEKVNMSIETGYPYNGNITVTFHNDSRKLKLAFALPPNAAIKEIRIAYNGKSVKYDITGGFLNIRINSIAKQKLHIEIPFLLIPVTAGKHTAIWYGPLLLGLRNYPERVHKIDISGSSPDEHGCCTTAEGYLLEPVNRGFGLSREDALHDSWLVLFQEVMT